MKVKPAEASVSIYRINGITKASINIAFPDVAIERDVNGVINTVVKARLEAAMRAALLEWELDVQDSDQ